MSGNPPPKVEPAPRPLDLRRVAVVLAEQIMDVLDQAGATEAEKLAACAIATHLIPVCSISAPVD